MHDAGLNFDTGADWQGNGHFGGGRGNASILRLGSLRVPDSTIAFQAALRPTPHGAEQATCTGLDLGGLDGGQTLLNSKLVCWETQVSFKADAGPLGTPASTPFDFDIADARSSRDSAATAISAIRPS
jgi:hypothetical protein